MTSSLCLFSCEISGWHGSSTTADMSRLAQEYKIHNAEVLFREDATIDDFIDVIEGNRKYTRCLYVYNKVRVCQLHTAPARRCSCVCCRSSLLSTVHHQTMPECSGITV